MIVGWTTGTDLLGNQQAELAMASGTRYQIIEVDGSIYFAVATTDGSWSALSTFGYAEAWRMRTNSYGPWRFCFKQMINDFVADGESDDDS